MDDYSGITNLEVMLEAKNYNRYLVDLVLSYAAPGESIVDFGAGAGTFALPVSRSGRNITCIEPDATLFAHLVHKGLKVKTALEQVDDSSVDYIYSLNVLEHIEDDAAVVALWHRKLKPGGTLLVYVPAFEILFSSMDRKVGHHRRYRMNALRDLLRRAGFTIDRATYVDSLGFPASIVFKMIGNDSGDINTGMLKLYDRAVFPVSRVLDRVIGRIGGKNLYVVGTKAQ